MSLSEALPFVAGLLGVALGGAISHWSTASERKARQADESKALERSAEIQAISDLLAATRLLSQRANGFRVTVKLLQSRSARRERRRGVLAPVDVDASFDRLVEADQRLGQATTAVWMQGDAEAVRLGNDVAQAAADVFDAHDDEPMGRVRSFGRSLQLQYTSALPGNADRIQKATRELAAAHKVLAEHARRKYGLEPVDLWASMEE